MYVIVLNNGNTLNIKANNVEWSDKSRTIRFLNDKRIVARINMDNIAGWIEKEYYSSDSEVCSSNFH